MMLVRRSFALSAIALIYAVSTPLCGFGQRPLETAREREARLARRSVGVRVGSWRVNLAPADSSDQRTSPQIEAYLQRGLDQHLGLENSVAVWRRTTQEIQTLPLGGDRVVETKSHIVPVITSLKFYPVTHPANFFDPYITGGVGVALGIVSEAENAIGGGGTSIATGFVVRTALGVEIHLTRALGLLANGRYQWMRFSEDLGSRDVFNGAGVDGGITYRFRF